MKEYTTSEPVFSESIQVVESTDLVNAENNNTSVLQVFQNTLHNRSEVELLKKSVSDGKSAVASAITDMGVSTAADDTFAEMAENIGNITPEVSVSGSVSGSWSGATFRYGGGASATAKINGKNQKTDSTSFSSKTTTVGGNATASDVVSGKTFSSNNAGREVNGSMIALRLTRLFTGNQTGYSAYEGFSENMYATVAFSSTQSSGRMIYIRFNTSSGTHEAWCAVGTSVTSNSWKFTVAASNIELKYVGTSSNQWIQIMAYGMTYAHSGWA